jgi:SAM-dependent methyltransferase
MFATGEFDVVVHPVSTCYVPDVRPVFAEVARVTRPGGLYISQHKSPVSLLASLKPDGNGYALTEPYYRTGSLPPVEQQSHLREPGTIEFLHRLEELLGGICRAGFAIEDVVEPLHAQANAAPGSFAHRAQFVAPYIRIKARRASGDQSVRSSLIV